MKSFLTTFFKVQIIGLCVPINNQKIVEISSGDWSSVLVNCNKLTISQWNRENKKIQNFQMF